MSSVIVLTGIYTRHPKPYGILLYPILILPLFVGPCTLLGPGRLQVSVTVPSRFLWKEVPDEYSGVSRPVESGSSFPLVQGVYLSNVWVPRTPTSAPIYSLYTGVHDVDHRIPRVRTPSLSYLVLDETVTGVLGRSCTLSFPGSQHAPVLLAVKWTGGGFSS